MDQRKSALSAWARRCLTELAGLRPESDTARALAAAPVETVSGDASFRRYFRIRLAAPLSGAGGIFQQTQSLGELLNNVNFVLVDAPPAHEDCHKFVRIAGLLRDAGLLTPRVIQVDYEQGFMLLEDFGDTLYLPRLLESKESGDTAADTLYQAAMAALIELQARGKGGELAPYDRALLRREMALFDEWFCERFLGLTLSEQERALLDETWTFLEDAALAQTQVCVHRDYHSRNLMILHDDIAHAPGVIDFQDAVLGACTYDLVSLLRDCYIVWPQERVRAWALQFHEQAVLRGILPAGKEASFLRDFDLMGLQRHIKVIGIFCRLNLRDGKVRYMADVPLVIDYVLRVAAMHPEMKPFLDWFQNNVLPIAQPKLQAFSEEGFV
ncbi:MAG: phosphotransferase [Pseudomonadota bacterium]